MVHDTTDRAVRRAVFELYGRAAIEEIQKVDVGTYQVTMTDGGISWATVQDDGYICIEPET